MYGYTSESFIEADKEPVLEPSEGSKQPLSERPKYTVLSVSFSDFEIVWCFGPGISAVFITSDDLGLTGTWTDGSVRPQR